MAKDNGWAKKVKLSQYIRPNKSDHLDELQTRREELVEPYTEQSRLGHENIDPALSNQLGKANDRKRKEEYERNKPVPPTQEELAQHYQNVMAGTEKGEVVNLNGQKVLLDDVDMYIADGPHDFADSYIEQAWVVFPDGTARELSPDEVEQLDSENPGLTHDKASTWHH
tara:strand:- start:701 stop:1207 length:507 start_codon:yes stop_codon:yes gene_type:complete